MSFVDPIGDMISRIRNGQMRNLKDVSIPHSNFRAKVLEVLKKEGFINDFFVNDKDKLIKTFIVNLKYNDGIPVIREIKRVSKPGRRIYASANSIPRIQNGLGISIVSTSKGVMSDAEAKKLNIGGEVICKVF